MPRDKRPRSNNLSQYGLIDIPNFDTGVGDDDEDDDEDLEAELAALTGGGGPKPKAKKLAAPLPDAQLDMMVADSLKDIPSDDDISVDENDPELLGELSELAVGDDESAPPLPQQEMGNEFPLPTSHNDPTVTLLTERLSMYETAEANAKQAHDTSKARRFGRGIKTLQELLKKAQSGSAVNPDDIPPPVSVAKPQPVPTPSTDEQSNLPPPLEPMRTAPAIPPQPSPSQDTPPPIPPRRQPSIPTPSSAPETPKDIPSSGPLDTQSGDPSNAASNGPNQKVIDLLVQRQGEYKRAALEAKKSGDSQSALTMISIFKQFDAVINLAKSGQAIDLSDMPPPPSELSKMMPGAPSTAVTHDEHQTSGSGGPQPAPGAPAAPAPASSSCSCSRSRAAYRGTPHSNGSSPSATGQISIPRRSC
ncbi:hypothetical protein WDU94_008023 [Cyamophila willieti]